MNHPQSETLPFHKDCAHQLKILADKTRLAVLELLMQEPKQVGEMQAILGLEQSLLSHHLQVLRESQLVISQRQGKAVLYQLSPQAMIAPDQSLNLGCCVLAFNSPSFESRH